MSAMRSFEMTFIVMDKGRLPGRSSRSANPDSRKLEPMIISCVEYEWLALDVVAKFFVQFALHRRFAQQCTYPRLQFSQAHDFPPIFCSYAWRNATSRIHHNISFRFLA
jgi:hypothetical protein